MSADELRQYFEQFAALLKNFPVNNGEGRLRIANAGEFMFMGTDDQGAHFKHRNSRQYINMLKLSDGWRLSVLDGTLTFPAPMFSN